MSKLKSTGPGISTSPLSTTSTSGRTAASSAEMSGGRATSRITAPGLHWLTSSTRCPKADVAVMIRSHWPTQGAVLTSVSTVAPGVSPQDLALQLLQPRRLDGHEHDVLHRGRQHPR